MISYVVPCCNRGGQLELTLPSCYEAAAEAAPMEVVVVDYNSDRPVADWIYDIEIPHGVELTVIRYTMRNYFHMAHSRNLGALQSSGDWLIPGSTDFYFKPGFFRLMGDAAESGQGDCYTISYARYPGVLMTPKREFVKAGGYDERFEFYGGEDKDLWFRLERRGLRFAHVPGARDQIDQIVTPNGDREGNYRLPLSKNRMCRIGLSVGRLNMKNGELVANEHLPWGR